MIAGCAEMIELDNVSVWVDDLGSTNRGARKTLLSGITLSLTEQRIALIGSNGAGKSTLLKLINALVLPSSGTVTVAGLDTKVAGNQIRKRVGYVFTDPLSQLVMSTPVDDVQLSLRQTIRNKKERRDRALAVLEERGLGHLANQSIYDLSGGERQLVSLTTVLATEPNVIVADEPTTLLDLRNRYQLRRAFAALSQQLIVSTHDLELAREMDRVIWLDGGNVAGDGAPEEILASYRNAMVVP